MPTPFNNSMSFEVIIEKLSPMKNGIQGPAQFSIDQCQHIKKSLRKLSQQNNQYSAYKLLHQMKELPAQNVPEIFNRLPTIIPKYNKYYSYCQKKGQVNGKNTLWDNIGLTVNEFQKLQLALGYLSNKKTHLYSQSKDKCQDIIAAYPILDEVSKVIEIQRKYGKYVNHPSTLSGNIEEIIKTFQIRGQFQHSNRISEVEEMRVQVNKVKDQLKELKQLRESFSKQMMNKFKEINTRINNNKQGIHPQSAENKRNLIKYQKSEKILKIGNRKPEQQKKEIQIKSMKVLEPYKQPIKQQMMKKQHIDWSAQVQKLEEKNLKSQFTINDLKQSNERLKNLLKKKRQKQSQIKQALTQFLKKITEYRHNPSNHNLDQIYLMIQTMFEKVKSSEIIPQYQLIENPYAKLEEKTMNA